MTEDGLERRLLVQAGELWQAGRPDQAEAVLRSVLTRNPASVDALVAFAELLGALSRGQEAVALLQSLFAAHPSVAAHARRLGAALLANGDHEGAMIPLQRAVALEPGNARGHNNLGEAYLAQGATELAIDCYRRAISCEPSRALAYNNLGRALLRSERSAEAVESLERAVALAPTLVAAHLNLGGALSSLGRFEEALASFERACALDPHHIPALVARARAFRTLGKPAEARRCLDRGLELNPDDVTLLSELGALLGSESEYLAAAPIFERLAAVVPELAYVKGYRLFLKLLCSNWNDYDVDNARLRDAVELGRRACTPFQSLLFFDSPADLRRCAETFIGDRYPELPARAPQAGQSQGPAGRIRVAYLSGDFGDHPVSHLLAGVLESHNVSHFDVWALGWGQQRQGPMRTRIERAVSRFIDISRLDDADVARLLRDSNVDIAVDLMGHTRDQRTGIFALRAAPIQINFLGFPGSMGASYMDFLIADAVVVPEGMESAYTERIARLPHCYLPFAPRRGPDAARPSRTAVGLPEQGFVFCVFNNPFKITPRWFDVWMRLLLAVPGSVLWLRNDDELLMGNLRREAAQRGVAPERLIFARRVDSKSAHLARYRSADLFLDTLPYNAHATACDALGAGLPVLTCQGSTFCGRVGSSLLGALGLNDLITADVVQYERQARALADDPGRLSGIRARLEASILNSPLCDPALYCRHLEAAYRGMYQQHRDGRLPESFSVSAIPATSSQALNPQH